MRSFALAILASAAAAAPMGTLEYEFVQYIAKFGKSYKDTNEYNLRFQRFMKRDQEIKEIMAETGLTIADLAGATASSKSAKSEGEKAKVAPKYRDPANASNTWSGRGRMPQWVAALQAQGALDSALIKG